MTSVRKPAGPVDSESERRSWPIVAIACGAAFTELLDASIINVALFTIADEMALNASELSWVVNAYLLMFGGLLLLGGRVADLFGQRRVLVAGLALFTVSSLLGGLAHNAVWLVLARGAQGVGAAIIAPATLAILITTFTEPSQRARAIGAWTVSGVAGAALGSLIGGLLTDFLGWRWVLWFNVPIGLALLIGALRSLPRTPRVRRPAWRDTDLMGATTVTAGLVCVVLGVVSTTSRGWSAPQTLAPLTAGAALLIAFLAIEQRAVSPVLPLDFLRQRTIWSGNIVAFLASAAGLPTFYLLALFLQGTLGFEPLEAGLAFLPISFAIIVGSFASSLALPRAGPRTPMVAGALAAAVGQTWLAHISTGSSYVWHVLPPSLLLGIGIGLLTVPVAATATANVTEQQTGLASGLLDTANQIGGALGLACLATIAAASTSGYLPAMLAAAAIFTTAGVAALLTPRRLPATTPRKGTQTQTMMVE